MNIQELLTLVRETRPNGLSNASLLRAVNSLEGRVQTELLHFAPDDTVSYSAVSAAELLLRPPHDRLYLYAMMSEVDYLLGETSLYQNDKIRADEAWEDLKLRLCRRGQSSVFGELLTLAAGTAASLSFEDLGLADDDVSAVTVTFTERGSTAFTKTEADALTYSGGTLTVPLTAEDTALLHAGVTTAQAVLTSADGEAVVKSRAVRILIKE